jgi:hypothetical protein
VKAFFLPEWLALFYGVSLWEIDRNFGNSIYIIGKHARRDQPDQFHQCGFIKAGSIEILQQVITGYTFVFCNRFCQTYDRM